jgi:hypothetical protein
VAFVPQRHRSGKDRPNLSAVLRLRLVPEAVLTGAPKFAVRFAVAGGDADYLPPPRSAVTKDPKFQVMSQEDSNRFHGRYDAGFTSPTDLGDADALHLSVPPSGQKDAASTVVASNERIALERLLVLVPSSGLDAMGFVESGRLIASGINEQAGFDETIFHIYKAESA